MQRYLKPKKSKNITKCFLYGSSVYIQNKMQMNQNREPSLINRLQVSHHNQAKMVLYIERIIVC